MGATVLALDRDVIVLVLDGMIDELEVLVLDGKIDVLRSLVLDEVMDALEGLALVAMKFALETLVGPLSLELTRVHEVSNSVFTITFVTSTNSV